ncbi:hypothetical protein EMIHUDRAFT_231847 [Emiliania huxleyi CCMP1516]|uniref:Ribosome biogenesis protein NOP53 n=2 Tax=Emiliania huxleyi TaxID=2903 RepID=A0A0D3K6S4_EMIH1|nr:hypothetical protein EMIHUDRAFT_231847 [Emiliania huxleyi CCMP1516]EOD31459.1 hypothetical protein EMIHUDRAFT_231847 [Emiliania huxleyi CCMP1516]|eukprot:XP_005783888.1 hypothetical protein EMIHUDRAFT_231847 [Emiliania huxleyi CCMP1516]
MARVAMIGTAAADPVADGAGAQAPATVVPPGMRSGRWNSSDRVQLEDAVMVARIAGASQVRLIRPGYATIEIDLKHEKAAGDRESVQAAERSYVERTAPKKKELTDEQLAARTASRKAKKIRQKERRAKEAGERAASEAERAEAPRAQLRENIEYVVAGLRSAAAQARSQAGSNIGVEYSLPPERDDGYRRGPSKVYAKVPQGTVATTVAPDWLANELAGRGNAWRTPKSGGQEDGAGSVRAGVASSVATALAAAGPAGFQGRWHRAWAPPKPELLPASLQNRWAVVMCCAMGHFG